MSRRRPTSTAKRRRGAPPKKSQSSRPLLFGAAAIVLVLIAAVWINSARSGLSPALAQRVETFPSEGAAHVPTGTKVTYRTDPPTSGPHYASPAPPGFYERALPDEVLVHNLEHGHVIIHYTPGTLTQEEDDYITTLTLSYTNPWAAVVAVPREGMEHRFILTAWRKMLRLDSLDKELVDGFIDAFIGRGPENPIR